MANKKKIIGLLAGLALLGGAGFGANAVFAAQNTNGHPNFMGNLAAVIAQKFNLNASDVQSVIDDQVNQQRAAAEEQHQQAFENRLTQAVSSGKLTQAQADLILAEKAKVKAQIDALKGKTGEELRTAIKQIMDVERQWATDNNIPQGYMMFGFGGPEMRKGGEFGDGMMHKQNASSDESSTEGTNESSD